MYLNAKSVFRDIYGHCRWAWNFVSHIEGRTQTHDVQKQRDMEEIWARVMGTSSKTENISQRKLLSLYCSQVVLRGI